MEAIFVMIETLDVVKEKDAAITGRQSSNGSIDGHHSGFMISGTHSALVRQWPGWIWRRLRS